MRQVLFSKSFISNYQQSPVGDVVGDFDQWMRSTGYHGPHMRRHLGCVRRALELAMPLPEDRRFDAVDLDRMFRSPVRTRGFAAARSAFEHYLHDRECWIEIPSSGGPHQALLDAYGTYLHELEGLAPSTILHKRRVVSAFLTLCCPPSRSLDDLTPRDVERFIARQAKRLGRSAMQSTVSYLRHFLRYCQERNLCAAGLDVIDRPQRYRDERPPRAIPWPLALQFLNSIDRSTRMGCRDHAMLYLMMHFGLRTGEVCGLQAKDVDLQAGILRVSQPKVHATAVLPVARHASRVLARYLRFGRPRTHRPELFLTVTAPLGRMNRGAVAALFQRHAYRSGLPMTGFSPYSLRHTFAMRLLERGVGIKAIGDLLGHRTLESTAVYLRLNIEALRDVALPVPTRRIHERRVS